VGLEVFAMITHLFMENFKSWKKTGAVRLAPITGLFGSNSSGKTSFLQLLLMLKQTAESSDRTLVLNLGDDRSLVELGVFRDVVTSHDAQAVLRFGLTWQLGEELKISDPEQKGKILFQDSGIHFEAEVLEIGSKQTSVSEFHYEFAQHGFGMKRGAKGYGLIAREEPSKKALKLHRKAGRMWELPAPVKCYGFPDQVKAYYQNVGFLSDLELEFEKLFARVFYLGPLREYPQRQYTWAGAQPADMGRRGERVVDALLASRARNEKISRGPGYKRFTLEEYVAHWLRKLGLIHEFFVEPITTDGNLYQVTVQRSPKSTKVLLTDVGFGVSQILPVLTLCYYVPEGSTILIEQPEIHLHPAVQAGLADVFIDAVKKRRVQIIVESHSEHLLRRLQLRMAEESLSKDDAALYFCSTRDGLSHLKSLHLNLYGEIENWPEDFFGDEFGELAAMAKAKAERQLREPIE
jgi:predicted ATPase